MKFSVLLSVYHKEHPDFLKLALESIWDKQTLKPLEIVIVKDGPLTPELDSEIDSFSAKAPVKIVALEKNMGLGYALNEGLKHCSNEWVARMDSDDISFPERFEKQVNFLNLNPDIMLLSSNIMEFHTTTVNPSGERRVPATDLAIRAFAKKRNPMNHMAIIYNKQAVLDAGNYLPFTGYEDYFLWVRMLINGCKASNLQECLVYARTGNNMIARRQGLIFFKEELKLQRKFNEIGFTNRGVMVQNLFLRAMPRLMPVVILRGIYKLLRK